jgi:ABC-type nickel/cobalt efflux system permease component RcnA
MSTTSSGATTRRARTERRVSTETKPSFKTTELIAYVATVIGVLVASAVVDANDADNLTGFDAHQAWTLVTFLTIGYMISRGLAKAGSREFYDDVHDDHDHDHDHDHDDYGNAGRRSAVSSAATHTATPTTGSTGGTDPRTTGSL